MPFAGKVSKICPTALSRPFNTSFSFSSVKLLASCCHCVETEGSVDTEALPMGLSGLVPAFKVNKLAVVQEEQLHAVTLQVMVDVQTQLTM